jgi:hypothetical protein
MTSDMTHQHQASTWVTVIFSGCVAQTNAHQKHMVILRMSQLALVGQHSG